MYRSVREVNKTQSKKGNEEINKTGSTPNTAKKPCSDERQRQQTRPTNILGRPAIPHTPMRKDHTESTAVPIDPSDILNLKELSERLKVSERWVYEKSRRRCQNPLPCYRIGRYLRFNWTSVSSWLRRQERTA